MRPLNPESFHVKVNDEPKSNIENVQNPNVNQDKSESTEIPSHISIILTMIILTIIMILIAVWYSSKKPVK